jgi:hypothetical protein
MARPDDILFVERAVKCFCQGRLLLPHNVGDGTAPMLHCHEVSRDYAMRNPGARVVHGWTANGIHRIGRAELALFQYHSVVELNRGELVDPNWCPGQEELFAEDVTRPYDYATRTAWNNLAIADRPFRCPVTGARLPAWRPIWRKHYHDTMVYSGDPRHARWRRFDRGEHWQLYVANLGLKPRNPIDVTFVTNLEFIFVEVQGDEPPPRQIKDFELFSSTLTRSTRAIRKDQVLSEAEEDLVRRASGKRI